MNYHVYHPQSIVECVGYINTDLVVSVKSLYWILYIDSLLRVEGRRGILLITVPTFEDADKVHHMYLSNLIVKRIVIESAVVVDDDFVKWLAYYSDIVFTSQLEQFSKKHKKLFYASYRREIRCD